MEAARLFGIAQVARLDGLRGMAALLVVGSHASLLGLHLLPGISLSGTGKYGVFLFFVLSAFLLTVQWLQQPAEVSSGARQRGPLVIYAIRRMLRIIPLYALVVGLGAAIGGRGIGVPMDVDAALRHLLMLEGRDIYWSVPVEFKYYALVPLAAWWWRRDLSLVVRVGATLLALGVVMLAFPAAEAPLNTIALGYYLPVFVAGSMAAWSWVDGQLDQGVAKGRPLWLMDLLLLLALVVGTPDVASRLGAKVGLDFLHRAYLGWGLFWAAVLLAVLCGWLPLWNRLFETALMRACGRWCFGIYLLHMPALYVAKRLPLPPLVAGWVGLALALAIAAAAHRFIERPAIAWGRRL